MKTILYGNDIHLEWGFTDAVTGLNFDFAGVDIKLTLFSCNKVLPVDNYTQEGGTINAIIPTKCMPCGVYTAECEYSVGMGVKRAKVRINDAFQISNNKPWHHEEGITPCEMHEMETVYLHSIAMPIITSKIAMIEYLSGNRYNELKENDCLKKRTIYVVEKEGEKADMYLYKYPLSSGSIPGTIDWDDIQNKPDIPEPYVLPVAEESALGGIKASPKTENETTEVKIGEDGKLYAPEISKIRMATENELGGIKASPKTDCDTVEIKIGEDGKLYGKKGVGGNPDNEDLCLSTNSDGEKVLKFNNKSYDASSFSGLGRVYLRKNIVSDKNKLSQDMINSPNTIYIIQYDYDLDGETINIPDGCILDFKGGSIKNGNIVFNNTFLSDNAAFKNVLPSGILKNDIVKTKWFVDGTSDDTTLLINTLINLYDHVEFSNMRHVLKATGTYSYVNDGDYCILISNNKVVTAEVGCTIESPATAFYIHGNNNIIDGINILWDTTPSGLLYTHCGITCNGKNNLIKNCRVINGLHGITVYFSDDCKIENCHLESKDHKGAASCHVAGSTRIFVTNCTILGGKDGNMNLYGECSECEVSGCNIGLSEQNVVIESSFNCKIDNCYIYGGGTYDTGFIGAIINRSFNCSVNNCNIYKLHYGIIVRETDIPTNITGYPCECISLTSNKISDIAPVEGEYPASRAIMAMYFKNILISGNTFYRCAVTDADILIEQHHEETPPQGADSRAIVISNNLFHKHSYEFGKGYFNNQMPAIKISKGGRATISNNSFITDNACDYAIKASVSELTISNNINNSSSEAGSCKFVEIENDADNIIVTGNIWKGGVQPWISFLHFRGNVNNALISNNVFDCFSVIGSIPAFINTEKSIKFSTILGNYWRGGNLVEAMENITDIIVTNNIINTSYPSIYYVSGYMSNIYQEGNIKHSNGSDITIYPPKVNGIDSYNQIYKGYSYYNTENGIQCVYDGNSIIGVDGYENKKRRGTTQERPSGVQEGFEFYDSTLKKKILFNGLAWVNMDGSFI